MSEIAPVDVNPRLTAHAYFYLVMGMLIILSGAFCGMFGLMWVIPYGALALWLSTWFYRKIGELDHGEGS